MERTVQIERWLESISADTYKDLQPASSDASFRRYFRVNNVIDGNSYIVMDAPPEQENCRPFVHVTELLLGVGAHAPEIRAVNLNDGFLLLEDLGNTPYLDILDENSADKLYIDAVDSLIRMQSIDAILPLYDARLLQREMDLFELWYVKRHLGKSLSKTQKAVMKQVYKLLISNAEQQPQVFVHRDFHSRNLMFEKVNNPGIIDYQDAVIGPISYDLVSLFKDCYIEWPREKIEHWLDLYLARLTPTHFIDKQTLLRWFDLMGLQRHLKVLGIFCRLNYRDDKPQYIDDLPLTYRYVIDACDRYDELAPLRQLLDDLHA